MGLFKSVKKFGKSVVKTVARAAPSAGVGFLTAGPAGALAGTLAGLTGQRSQQTAIAPGTGLLSSIQTSFGGPFGLPTALPQQFPAMAGEGQVFQTGGAVMLTESLFNVIVKLAQAMGHTFRSAQGVHRWGRMIVAKLLRFARANPGLTIVNLLANIGLSAVEINELLTWWATAGKKHRRIKVTNVKALNRSVRRLEGFRRLSHRVEMALSRRGVTRTIATRRRCPKCRKSPCCC